VNHKTKTITRGRNTKIDRCSCGAVHLHVGSTSLRISADVARELRDTLVGAFAEIDKPTVTEDAPAIRLVTDSEGSDEDSKIH